jgi:anti-sigma B factor antagonist
MSLGFAAPAHPCIVGGSNSVGGIMSVQRIAEPQLLCLALTCGPVTIIELRGVVDMDTAHSIMELVNQVAKSSPSLVILDMGEISFFCAAGLRALLKAQKRIKEAGGQLRLRDPSPATRRVLTITGTADTFPIDRQPSAVTVADRDSRSR